MADVTKCDALCGCPDPCPGGTACRCEVVAVGEGAETRHATCSCGQHCSCNPCSCGRTAIGVATGRGTCTCGVGCTCATCAA